MNPGERLYERLSNEIGLSIVEVMTIIDRCRDRARTDRARLRLVRLEGEYFARVARDVDPRWL